jgi:predicted AlkP superfamily phosphohydrolase/phosphomutase
LVLSKTAFVLLAAFGLGLSGCGPGRSPASGKKVIVLGVDGMDPSFLEQHWRELPQLDRLHRQGNFRRLRTTTPPQSPVAWSTFITGTDPSAHGIFDFVHRDPITLEPLSSIAKTEGPRFVLPLGRYVLPLSPARVRTLRQGRTFWEILSDQGISVTVIHMPTNYPPAEAGRAIGGMGVPDLGGTLGRFTLYTDDPEEISRTVPGGRFVRIQLEGSRAVLPVEGPPNPIRKDSRISMADLTVDVDREESLARLATSNSMAIVKQGEWSPWLTADFPLLGEVVKARGMFRVYARQLHSRTELYLSPVNVDPAKPELPVSFPAGFSREAAREIGRFYTLGIAEDTSALRHGVFTLQEYLEQSRLVLEDEMKLLRYSLRHFSGGLLFFYFSSIDQNSHVLWGRHESELARTYQAIDALIGEVIQREPAADVIVLSDHGFTTFDRAFHLNTWLRKHGFLALKAGAAEGAEMLANVDWAATRAYALGLNGLYLNLAGREKYGIVKAGAESRAVLEEIRGRILGYRDPESGQVAVKTVFSTGPKPDRTAPDLIIGYAPGYRASWQTALGGAPIDIATGNHDAWIGDHCINASDVPGVLLTNRSLRAQNPELKDVTVSVLSLFGVGSGSGMHGQVVY